MRIIRFKNKNDEVQFGWISQEKVGLIQGDPFGEFRRFEPTLFLSELELLLPCQPSKIIAVGRNYAEHAAEMNNEVPAYPMIFMKPPSALITMVSPSLSPRNPTCEHEAELTIVLG
jgi:2-keto-4-pentenoate hydratase/2-oxohepta-3-ene-1,7-dioic acid hydratase in catechol pathway